MPALAGPLFAAAALLAIAGAGKVARPDATRVALRRGGVPSSTLVARGLGAVEVAIGVAAIALGGPIPAMATAAAYLGFAWFAHRLDRASQGTADCGCFGSSSAPVGTLHVVVNLAIAAVCAAAAVTDPVGIAAATTDTPWAGVPFLALTALLTWMLSVTLTVLPTALAAAKEAAASAASASATTGSGVRA